MKRYRKSLAKWKEHTKYVVPGSATISKKPHLYTFGAYPIFLRSGKGAIVKDVDGHSYIDYQSALGATILGMSYPRINLAIRKQIGKGTLFSLAQDLQTELARRICRLVPCAERVRFLKNGSDATSAAIRIARAHTGRTKILSCHFHGWHDWFYITTSMNRGIPQALKEDIFIFEYNDLAAVEELFKKHAGQVAAVIMEPVHLDAPKGSFLKKVKALARKNGALLIFDEVVTGFRFSLGGAQEYFGITPDLCTLAKAMGNGSSLSAVAGRGKIMDGTEDVVTSLTYGEETLPMAAAIATLDELESKPVIKHIWTLGKEFQDGYNARAGKYGIPTACIGFPPRMELVFSDGKHPRKELKAYVLQETARHGILFGCHIFLTYSHTNAHIRKTLRVCEKIFADIATMPKKLPLEGKLPVEPW